LLLVLLFDQFLTRTTEIPIQCPDYPDHWAIDIENFNL
jgi:hypothetical protein